MRIKAKTCDWGKEDNNTWHDKTHGMSIVLRLEFDEYYAEFNEVIGEYFKTLQEAKDWCQSEMDDYINVHGVIETEQ